MASISCEFTSADEVECDLHRVNPHWLDVLQRDAAERHPPSMAAAPPPFSTFGGRRSSKVNELIRKSMKREGKDGLVTSHRLPADAPPDFAIACPRMLDLTGNSP